MTQTDAQSLLDILYNNDSEPDDKEQAYLRLKELFDLLLPKE